MGTTVKAVLLQHQNKGDGTNFFRIRVTHCRKSRYIKTNISVGPDDFTRSGNLKDGGKKDLAKNLEIRLRGVLDEMDMFDLRAMTIDEVVEALESQLEEPEEFRLDFIEFGRQVADKKSQGTAGIYHTSLNALVRFFKGRHPDISEITVRNLRGFEEFLRNEPVVKVNWRTGDTKVLKKKKGARAPSQYIGALRHIYKSARIEFNDPDIGKFLLPVDPFEYYSVPKIPSAKHRDIPVEVIQHMIDTRHELKGRVRMAVDAFLISFGMMGINAADMFTCQKASRDILHYNRKKTEGRRDDGAEMRVRMEPCIRCIVKDYKNTSAMNRMFDYFKRYSNSDTFTTALNQGLRIWCKRYKEERFTFYSARHSWATIGRGKRCNVDKSLITAGLCHVDSSKSSDDVYIRQDWEQLWDANAKILSIFDWK